MYLSINLVYKGVRGCFHTLFHNDLLIQCASGICLSSSRSFSSTRGEDHFRVYNQDFEFKEGKAYDNES